MRRVKHPIIPLSQSTQSRGADCCEESETDEAEDDVFVLDAFCEEAGENEEVGIEQRVQSEEQEDDATEDLMRGFEVFV
jgi:hypothetical protein